jgi:hypothetical protein
MQQIEGAVGQCDALARVAPLLDLPAKFFAAQDFVVCARRVHSIAMFVQ